MNRNIWSGRFDETIGTADPDLAQLLADQVRQGRETINLVASESYCPRAALEAEASALVNKNASGYPPRRSVGGGDILDAVERLAIERACRLFGAEYANVQALSSTIANVAVLRALLAPGERILAFDPAAGGHHSHGGPRHISGQDYEIHGFGTSTPDEIIDYEAVARRAEDVRPRMIIAGTTSYPLAIDFARLHEIARGVGAMLFADIAHVSGLVAAGLHQNPSAFADVVTTSTHKTLCGPRTGGLILCKAEHGRRIDEAVSPGLQAAPGGHIIAGRAVLFAMVREPWFGALMRDVLSNATALAEALRDAGLRLYAGGTDTHMVVVDLRGTAWEAGELNARLLDHAIVASTTSLPPREGAHGRLALRLGATAMTIRGANRADMTSVADALARLVKAGPDGIPDPGAGARMRALSLSLPIPFQSLSPSDVDPLHAAAHHQHDVASAGLLGGGEVA